MLGQNTFRCTITLLDKKNLSSEINLIHINNKAQVDIFTKALGTYKLKSFKK
jgi:hypothetical protein